NGNLTVKEGHEISGAAKTLLLNECPNVIDVIIHLEPNS
ncbi:MAG: cation-efflux pump, partial [Elusimicrobia bacterium]|nr:cation-efflux pump [Elusimicrobiota bacterium]